MAANGSTPRLKPDWVHEFLELRSELGRWVHECMDRQRHVPWRGIHDEGNFTNAMAGYYLLTGDEEVRLFLESFRDAFLDWGRRNFHHGYYPTDSMDFQHGIENFFGFLTNLVAMGTGDTRSASAIEDVAHHLGNWVEGIPPWYDWENHRMRSSHLGTRSVRDHAPYTVNGPSDAWAYETALTAYLITRTDRYLDLARDWADMWCSWLSRNPGPIPVVFYQETDPAKARAAYGERYFADGFTSNGYSWKDNAMLVMFFLLRLGLACGDRKYLESARGILGRLSGYRRSHWDPLGDPETSVRWIYRNATGDHCFDERLVEWARGLPMGVLPTIMMMEKESTPSGWRNYWVKVYAHRAADGSVQAAGPRPLDLLAAYDLAGRTELLGQSMRMARHVLTPARVTLRDGRDHGCSQLVYAHGAAEEAAYVLWSVAFGRQPYYRLRYFRRDGGVGLPAGVAALCEAPEPGVQSVTLYNDSEEEQLVTIQASLGGHRSTIGVAPGSYATTAVPIDESRSEGNLLLFGPIHVAGG